jgi:hypothetical protein
MGAPRSLCRSPRTAPPTGAILSFRPGLPARPNLSPTHIYGPIRLAPFRAKRPVSDCAKAPWTRRSADQINRAKRTYGAAAPGDRVTFSIDNPPGWRRWA